MIYITLLLFLFVAHLGKTDNPNKRAFVFIIVSLITCCGYMCGSDWRGYELHYDDLDEPLEYIKKGILEPGIYALMFLFKQIGISYWGFSCILKVICLIPIWTLISRFSENKLFYLSLLFFFCFYGLSLFVDCPFRNLCSISICSLLLINYKKGLFYHIIIIIVAFFFHSSALIMLPFLFYMKKDIKVKYFIIVYCVVFFVSIGGNLLNYISKIPLLDTLFIGEKINRYAVEGHAEDSLVSNPFSLFEMLRTVLFIWLVLNKRWFTNNENQRVLFNGAITFFILAKFGIAVELFIRFSFYYSAFFAVGIVHLATKNIFNIKTVSYSFLVTTLSIIICAFSITADYRYLPYTNYIYYKILKDSLPSYSERDAYNFKNSPYSYKNKN